MLILLDALRSRQPPVHAWELLTPLHQLGPQLRQTCLCGGGGLSCRCSGGLGWVHRLGLLGRAYTRVSPRITCCVKVFILQQYVKKLQDSKMYYKI